MQIDQKLEMLRQSMKNQQVAAVIIPSADPHMSEYLANGWKDREWISGFTGSAGTVIVTLDKAGLWTDSRYFIQAEKELSGTEIKLHKLVQQFVPEHLEWLKKELKPNDVISVDGFDFSKTGIDQLKHYFSDLPCRIATNLDLVSQCWTDRPTLGSGQVKEHNKAFTGASRSEKLAMIRSEMEKVGAKHYLINALDEIAWCLNIRGNDVDYNPVVISYLLVSELSATWFVGKERLTADLKQELLNDSIVVAEYQDIIPHLNHLPENEVLMTEAASVNFNVHQAINCQKIYRDSPARILKGEKTETEIVHIKETMVSDGVALAYAFRWLEDELKTRTVGEFEFAEKIAACRSSREHYEGESFGAIIGYRENGAIVHYHPSSNHQALIKPEGVLLVDCGGQYQGGTTDITRTIALSIPVPQQLKQHYTMVLKGHIALAEIVFPSGTSGSQLEVLARQYLWEQGLNYLHGTGHGIGYYLNVHEGPHGLAVPTTERGRTPLKPGMVISNEPGFYLEGQYGIRIENVVVVRSHRQFNNFLQFETVSLYPIDLELADEKMLTTKEKAWINKYNEKCFQKISPFLSDDMKTWFRHKCKLLN